MEQTAGRFVKEGVHEFVSGQHRKSSHGLQKLARSGTE
jgi:hypothetical protein